MVKISKIVSTLEGACRKIPKRNLENEAIPKLLARLERESGDFLNIASINGEENFFKVTPKDFDRTRTGDVFLYRGVSGVTKEMAQETAHLSNAASLNIKLSEILEKFGIKSVTKKNRLQIMSHYSGLTQSGDPILHTTRSQNIAKTFTDNAGAVITYKMPVKKLEQIGVLGHHGEQEVDFLFKIPKKYVYKVEPVGNPEALINSSKLQNNLALANKGDDIIEGIDLPPPPSEISQASFTLAL